MRNSRSGRVRASGGLTAVGRRVGLATVCLVTIGKTGLAAEEPGASPEGMSDRADGVEAARKLSEDLSPQSTQAILAALDLGVPPGVAAELLSGLGRRRTAGPSAAVPGGGHADAVTAHENEVRIRQTLEHYARNRNLTLRRKAVVELGELAEMAAVPALVSALSDVAPDVRAAGAEGLSRLSIAGDRADGSLSAAEEALVRLLARQDQSAVAALGKVSGPSTVRALGARIGTIPDGLLANTFAAMLRRDDFGPDPLRLEVVSNLGKLTGPEGLAVLEDYLAATGADKQRPSRQEAARLVELRGASVPAIGATAVPTGIGGKAAGE